MLATLIAIAVLLFLSAFFSGSETALTAASRPLMHQLEQDGNMRAVIVNRLRQQKERLIGAILLGNNLVNILASALATSVLIGLYGEAGVVYATLAMTVLVLIFSEILPKTYAFKRANNMALAIAPLVNAIVLVLAPVTAALNMLVRGLFALFRVDFKEDEAQEPAEGELRGAIDLHDGEERIVRHERAMLRSVLDLDDVHVSEIMAHRKNVAMINADLPVETVVAMVSESPYPRIPLWRGQPDNIVGVLHAKALLRAFQAGAGKRAPLEVVALAAKPWFIPESTTLLDQLHAFRRRRQHFALMVDEYGSLMGIVTLEDILEEIVGEISDEHDVAATGVKPEPGGAYMVDGSVTIRDLNRQFDWDLPDKDAATVAGLILLESRRIPEVGQAFMFHDFRFEILRRVRHQITSVRITPPKESGETPKPDKPETSL